MRAIGRETFDGAHLFAGRRADERLTRPDRFAVEVHGAGSALSDPASILRPREPEDIAERPQQRHRRVDLERPRDAIDRQSESHHAFSVRRGGLPAQCTAPDHRVIWR
jgi:hypothetical protein